MSLDAFETLIDIERQCRAYAKVIPLQRVAGQIWQGIGFITANKNFLSPLQDVKEVLTPSLITPFPAAAPWFLGIITLRGQVLPVTDLECFLFGSKHELSDTSRILVVDFEKTGVGFLVEHVVGVERFLDKTMKTVIEGEIANEVKANLQGEFVDELSRWYVLSLKNLSQTGQFYHVVKESGV
jgi:twitching motility protein PilI